MTFFRSDFCLFFGLEPNSSGFFPPSGLRRQCRGGVLAPCCTCRLIAHYAHRTGPENCKHDFLISSRFPRRLYSTSSRLCFSPICFRSSVASCLFRKTVSICSGSLYIKEVQRGAAWGALRGRGWGSMAVPAACHECGFLGIGSRESRVGSRDQTL